MSNIQVTEGEGTAVGTDLVGGVHYQITKIGVGIEGAITFVSDSNPMPIKVVAQTTGGLESWRDIDLGATGQNIKAAAGQVKGWYIYNKSISERYIKFYDKAIAPTVGTDTPKLTIALPPQSASNVNYADGIQFSNGIGIGATKGVADGNTDNPESNDVIANIFYK
jgi:hypothetical protein